MSVPTKGVCILILCVAILFASGCNSGAKAIERQQQYAFNVMRPEDMPRAADATGTLRLRRFTIASQFESYGLVYRRTDLVYESDFYNRYFAPPASMITERTRQWLAASGVFAHVLDNFSGAPFDYVLEGSMLALYGDYRRKDSPQAVVEIQFTLIDEQRARDSVLLQKKYAAVADMQSATAAELVQGFNASITQILKELEADLAAVLPVAAG